MDMRELNYYYNKFKYGEDIFHTLMRHRVREVLLVSTFYDAFMLEQDGRISEQVLGQYRELNLTLEPRITSVPTGEEALRKLQKNSYDLVITMPHIGEIKPTELAQKAKEIQPDIPVLLLLNSQSEIEKYGYDGGNKGEIDNVFIWKGDPKLFLAMIKYIEDLRNIERDTRVGMVRVILLVEDSISFYSRYLPELYVEIVSQVQRLISEELSTIQRNTRMRSRPKVLMAHTYEEAIEVVEKYASNLLCVITDIRYPNQGELDPSAGLKLVSYLNERGLRVPVTLQSAEESLALKAEELRVAFLNKSSKSLMADLSHFIHANLGFGDFVFRDGSGEAIDTAQTMAEFEAKLAHIPDASLLYHSTRNHFSTWLQAHGAIHEARAMKPMTIDDFSSASRLRDYLANIFMEVRAQKHKGRIVDFEVHNAGAEGEITRLSHGSLGGKGRGIAFLNALLTTMEFKNRFPGLQITVPQTAFIGTSEYDRFVKENLIRERIREETSDEEIKQLFVAAKLSQELRTKLRVFLSRVRTPLAVRSSGLLEDSQSQPFAGVYQTYMLPNNHVEKRVRLRQLENAIKLVYASTFLHNAQSYIHRIDYRSEEEKMAVIIQEIAGSKHESYFYPHFSGVAQSYNYYPTSYMKHADGTVSVALGLGYWVVGGNHCYRFCPRFPKLQILQPEELMKNSQTQFYALDLLNNDFDLVEGETATLATLELADAERQGTLNHIASTWDHSDGRLRDTIRIPGPRVLTFASVLKFREIPLAEVLEELLDIGEKAFGTPVEMEFAVDMSRPPERNGEAALYVLQIRPLSVDQLTQEIHFDDAHHDELILYTNNSMGNGVVSDIYDVVYIDPLKWDRTRTMEMQRQLRAINESFPRERKYILIGPGRWGSRDRFLGVPVQWAEIDRAKVIVETTLDGFFVEASQGTHFFHNVVAMNAGYFTVPHCSDQEFIDWDWLREQDAVKETTFFRHVRVERPFVVQMSGRQGVAMIYKPDEQ